MGDLLGLSVSHVSRSLRQLREDRLISIECPSVIIVDFEGLATMADFETFHSSRLRINDVLANQMAANEALVTRDTTPLDRLCETIGLDIDVASPPKHAGALGY